jgi:hypothetical protein
MRRIRRKGYFSPRSNGDISTKELCIVRMMSEDRTGGQFVLRLWWCDASVVYLIPSLHCVPIFLVIGRS